MGSQPGCHSRPGHVGSLHVSCTTGPACLHCRIVPAGGLCRNPEVLKGLPPCPLLTLPLAVLKPASDECVRRVLQSNPGLKVRPELSIGSVWCSAVPPALQRCCWTDALWLCCL